MNIFKLSCLSLRHRSFHTVLCVMMTAFSVMAGVLVILTADHIQSRISRDTAGIDLVIGARGSPLQIILSSLYQVDIPTGNMPMSAAKQISEYKDVATAIPLALGDNAGGFRIVGTTPAYIDLYRAVYAEGKVWDRPFEAVAGAFAARALGMKVGDRFTGSHGLGAEGHHHREQYIVTGILKTTGTLIDRLIVTSVASVQEVHGQHEHHDEDDHDEDEHEHAGSPEITALLVKAKNPRAVVNLPREINRETQVMAASPAMELTRLTAMMGLSGQLVMGAAVILMIMAALSIFGGLASSLENRGQDLAVMRLLGMSQWRLFVLIVSEALITALMGVIVGIIAGHGLYAVLISQVDVLQASGASAFTFSYEELILGGVVVCAGLLAAFIPAIRAYRMDIVHLLQVQGAA